jgi:PAS domain S-box-containing protein
MGRRIFFWTGLDSRELLLAALALMVIVATIASVVEQIGKRFEQSIESSLTSVLGSTDETLRLWAMEQKSIVRNLAEGGVLTEATQALLAAPQKQADLLSSPAQGELRKLFHDYLKGRRFQGFFIISPSNLNLASSRDRNVGTVNLLSSQPDVLARLWQGETVIGRVMWSDVPLTSQQEADIGTRDMTLFVGTPIRDASGKLIALLTLRIDPNRALFPLLQHARLGKTGETYIFDRRGLLLSPIRFIDGLVKFGVIQPGQSSVLRIRIQDHSQSIPIEQRPLTRMAASATQGQRGTDLSGYRDYRGEQVVGAWLWNTEMDVGLAAEQDISEAKSALTLTTNLVYGAGGIASVALLLVLYSFGAGRRQLRETQSRLGAVVNSAVDSIVVIDTSGQIESVNPATETMFGYTAEWLVGRNVRELMPEPYRAEHDSYLARYLNTGEARVVGIGREVEARRADGSTFPVELDVNRLEMESGLHFSGVIRDVTRRKEAEAALEEERRFSQKALNALASHIAVLDETGRIVFVNDAWRKFAQENGLRDEQACLGQNYLEVSQSSRGLWSDEAPEVSKNLAAMLADEKESFVLEYPCHGPAGQRWFLLLASRFRLRGRAMIVMSHENITARRLAEDKLRQEKEATEASNRILSLTQTAMARSGIGEFWIHVQSGRFLRVSDRFCDDLGYSREELLSMSVFDVSREHSAKDFR